jgi:hypothetical protein
MLLSRNIVIFFILKSFHRAELSLNENDRNWLVELGKHTEDIISLENRRKSRRTINDDIC